MRIHYSFINLVVCVCARAFADRLVDPALLDSSTLGMLSHALLDSSMIGLLIMLFSIAMLILLFSILPIFHLNNSGSLSPCPFHSTYSLPSCVPILLFSILPIFHLNNSGSLSPCPFHSTYSLLSSVPFAIATRMVVAVSVLILSYSRGKPVTENKAYARCASIKATNVPELI